MNEHGYPGDGNPRASWHAAAEGQLRTVINAIMDTRSTATA